MQITVERERTVGDLLASIRDRYGSKADLEAYLEENPRDGDARVALHDLRAYEDRDPDERIEDTREIVLLPSALGEGTVRRLQLLLSVKRLGGQVDGLRGLARRVERDGKNVSEDVDALGELGLLTVTPRGPGRAHRIELPGHRIDLHLLEREGPVGGGQPVGPSTAR
jgi:hypothetical protein